MIRFFLPGPVHVREEIGREMMRPMMGHRSPEFRKLYQEIGLFLQELFGAGSSYAVFTCSATGLMEAAFLNVRVKSCLCLVGGAFAARWREIARRHCPGVEALEVPPGEAVTPELLERALLRKRYEAVTITHCETSTGTLAPLEELAKVIRRHSDALILVDAVSSWGGVSVPFDRVDYCLAGVQKAFALPPGISLLAVSPRFLAAASREEKRSYYFDVVQAVAGTASGDSLATPSLPHWYALHRQLATIREEGISRRFARHRELLDATQEWAGRRGLSYFSRSPSPTVSCLSYPKAELLVKKIKEQGYVVGGGYGELKSSTFRIGHMGEVDLASLRGLFQVLERELDEISRAGG